MNNSLVLILAAVMALGSNLNAAGFRLSEQDAKAAGMGNAFTAVADNASAVWYNPAAITNLEGTNLSLGSVMVAPSMEHKNTDANGAAADKIKNKLHIPPHFYATHKMNDHWSLGLGVNAPFGLATEWNKTDATTRIVATKSEIEAIYTNMNGAYKLNDKLSFGLGLAWVNLDAEMNKKIEMLGNNVEQKLTGNGTGWGYNAAAFYKYTDKLQFGANFRSKVKVDVDGKIKLPTTGVLATLAADGDATTSITLPDLFQLGAAYKYSDKWLFSAEADYTDWTTYRKLVIDYDTTAGVAKQSIDYKNWKSVWAFRAGTEYKYSDAWKFRGGAFYDLNPVKEKYFETRVPDSDRVGLSVGAGYTKGSITVDASYMYIMFLKRTVSGSVQDDALTGKTTVIDGKYTASAHLSAITVSYKF
ncbi:MAG: outer membrane protein transport protein [Elusimicrobiales bacterium]